AHAFQTADRATDLADLSREFRGALITMRSRTRDFVAHPSQELIQSFATTHDTAGRTLAAINAAADESVRKKIVPLQSQIAEVGAQFDNLTRSQKTLGFTEAEGLRARMN